MALPKSLMYRDGSIPMTGILPIQPAGNLYNRAELHADGLAFGDGTQEAERLVTYARQHGLNTLFYNRVGMKFSARTMGLVPTDTPDELNSASAANLHDNRNQFAVIWEKLRPLIVAGVDVVLDFEGGMYGVNGGIRFYLPPNNTGTVTFDFGTTGGLFFNKRTNLTGSEFSLFLVGCEGASPTDPMYCHNVKIVGGRFEDPDSAIHSLGEESHGIAIYWVDNFEVHGIRCFGVGDEALEITHSRRGYIDNCYFENCVNLTVGDGGCISIKQGCEDLVLGTNRFHDCRSSKSPNTLINIKLINPYPVRNVHLGTVIATGTCDRGISFNPTAESIYNVTMDRLSAEHLRGEPVIRISGTGKVVDGVHFRDIDVRRHDRRITVITSGNRDWRWGTVRLANGPASEDALYLAGIEGDWSFDRLDIDTVGQRALNVQTIAPDASFVVRSGSWKNTGAGTAGTTAVVEVATVGANVTLGEVHIDTSAHAGSRATRNVRRLSGTRFTGQNLSGASKEIHRPLEVERISASGDFVMTLNGGAEVQWADIARLSGRGGGCIAMGGSVGNRIIGGRYANPAGPALSGTAANNSIAMLDYSGCTGGLGPFSGTDLGGHVA